MSNEVAIKRGRGRPRKADADKVKELNIMVDDALRAEILRHANECGISVSELMRRACNDWFKR